MADTAAGSTTHHQHTSLIQQNPRRPYVPGVREPYALPDQIVEIPAPKALPREPAPFNFLTLLTPVLTTAASLAMRLTFMKDSTGSDWMLYLMVGAGVIHPISNIIGVFTKKSQYKKEMESRERRYQQELSQISADLTALAQSQFSKLQEAYPAPDALRGIALARGGNSRLWYRRLGVDSDFMSLRAGTRRGPVSFTINKPRSSDPSDPLLKSVDDLVQQYSTLSGLPFLIPMAEVGSLGIVCADPTLQSGTARRLLMDALTHHSPDNLRVFLISDKPDGPEVWDWIKWAPHTGALIKGNSLQQIAFDKADINSLVRWLMNEQETRSQGRPVPGDPGQELPSVLVILDDCGIIRQMPELTRVIKWGQDTRINTILIGEQNLPQIRVRMDIDQEGKFRYVETWEGGSEIQGIIETLPLETALEMSRALAGLETLGGKITTPLPNSLALSESIDNLKFSSQAIEENWNRDLSDYERLQFPIGVNVTPDGLASLSINLLPAERGGYDAYHSILIGTTGSGKSEFMKSIVLGAAYQYSPDELNFFFMDFKGGAAFDPFKRLPHVSGVVTNLTPELVDRGLVAVQSEIARRQESFSRAAVRDIWAYNQNQPQKKMPHLWLLLDEFAKGLADFPELKDVLDLLVRQGRSLGMYLLLANQDVSSAVDKLLSNVGWRIALKVARRDELTQLLEEKRNPTVRPGHGYLRTLNGDILEFQSGYSGVSVVAEGQKISAGFVIYRIGPDGRQLGDPVYEFNPKQDLPAVKMEKPASEQDALVGLMLQAAENLALEHARPIYLDPMPGELPLSEVIQKAPAYRAFQESGWSSVLDPSAYLKASAGMLDYLEEGIQIPLSIDFSQKDGHLWMAGAPGSGKEPSLLSILFSLAATHTPEEVNFYILECGSGALMKLGELPHTGAVVRLAEEERLERLLSFLDREMENRQVESYSKTGESGQTELPRIFLVVNNFGELRQNHMEVMDRISGYIQGSKVGIHLILISNLIREIPTKITNNIARRIILQMASYEELNAALGHKAAPLSARNPGRGYWIDESTAECQLAQPCLLAEDGPAVDWRDALPLLKNAWSGQMPRKIETLREVIPFADLIPSKLDTSSTTSLLPIGVAYDNQELVVEKIANIASEWIVIGETRSGKSNFLVSAAESLKAVAPQEWQIIALALRPSPLRKLGEFYSDVEVLLSPEQAKPALEKLIEALGQNSPLTRKMLLLIDDLGCVFEPASKDLETLLNTVGSLIQSRGAGDTLVLMAGMLGEFRAKSGTNSLIRAVSQNKTGLCFSLDMGDWSWLGVTPQAARPYQKITRPPGRGFYVNRGNPTYLQALLMNRYH